MPSDFLMPSLGADMEFGTIIAWHKKVGDLVQRGDILVDVETDKGTIEVEVWQSGIIADILVAPGSRVPVSTILAKIAETSKELGSTPTATSGLTKQVEVVATAPSVAAASMPPPGPTITIREKITPSRIRITPLARRIATEKHLPLDVVIGTGFHGTIKRADVEAAGTELGSTIVQEKPPTAHSSLKTAEKVDVSTAMRHAIAVGMEKSKREIPHYYMQTEVCMDRALAWVTLKNTTRSVSDRLVPPVLYLAAVARALHEFPEMNGFWTNGTFHPSTAIHIGMATSLRRGGLVTPAVHNVDHLSVDELMTKLRDLVTRTRAGTMRSSEIVDATITVTSLGDTGVETVFGIIYPPQVAIVGFGKISERPWAESGMIGARQVVTVTLAGDHRASDGHRGGLFLAEIRRLLQNPDAIFTPQPRLTTSEHESRVTS